MFELADSIDDVVQAAAGPDGLGKPVEAERTVGRDGAELGGRSESGKTLRMVVGSGMLNFSL